MKLAILKIVTNEQTTQGPVPAIIEDALPPPIYAVAGEPIRARSGRHLDVDGILARSLPRVAEKRSGSRHERDERNNV
jgi:hypothetical protein